jgi:hypothetical protein
MLIATQKKGRRLVDIGRKCNISQYRLISRPIEKTRREILINGRLKRRISQAEAFLTKSQKQGCPYYQSNIRNS